jgi:hypothetical protein
MQAEGLRGVGARFRCRRRGDGSGSRAAGGEDREVWGRTGGVVAEVSRAACSAARAGRSYA